MSDGSTLIGSTISNLLCILITVSDVILTAILVISFDQPFDFNIIIEKSIIRRHAEQYMQKIKFTFL